MIINEGDLVVIVRGLNIAYLDAKICLIGTILMETHLGYNLQLIQGVCNIPKNDIAPFFTRIK